MCLQDMLFTPVIVEVKGYFEVFFEESPPFKLSLTDADSGHTVWTATIREGTASAHKHEMATLVPKYNFIQDVTPELTRNPPQA